MAADKSSVFYRVRLLCDGHYSTAWGIVAMSALILVFNPVFMKPWLSSADLWFLVHIGLKLWIAYFALRVLPGFFAYFITQGGTTRRDFIGGAARAIVYLSLLQATALTMLYAAAFRDTLAGLAEQSGISAIPAIGVGWRLGDAVLLFVSSTLVSVLVAAAAFVAAMVLVGWFRRHWGMLLSVVLSLALSVVLIPIVTLPAGHPGAVAFSDLMRMHEYEFYLHTYGVSFGQATLPAVLGLYGLYAASGTLLFLASYAMTRNSGVFPAKSR